MAERDVSSLSTLSTLSTLCLALTLAACGTSPRLSTLARSDRAFEFRHDIELFETANGLTVALIADHRTNLATVDVRYDVGAIADPPGRHGLAHLVEHAMFLVRSGPTEPSLGHRLDELALWSNAYTTWDETHYTSIGPASALGEVLALEARRMSATCAEIDAADLARERDVVLAEASQSASAGAVVEGRLRGLIFGPDHPYARDPGSREVAAATRQEVCDFIAAHYSPDRAYLVVTGAFDPVELRGQIARTFGAVVRHATVPVPSVAAADLHGQITRHTLPIERATALVAFPFPAWGVKGGLANTVAANLLRQNLVSAGASVSWIADSDAWVEGGARTRVLVAMVSVESPDRLESAVEVIYRAAAAVSSSAEFRATPTLSAALRTDLERWDELAGRGAWIADYLQHAGHRWFMLDDLAVAASGWRPYAAEVAADLRPERSHVLLVSPEDGHRGVRVTGGAPVGTHDQATWRRAVDEAEADRPLRLARAVAPPVERYTLANGLEVVLAPDDRSPLVEARLQFPAGTAHQPADQPMLAAAGAYLLVPDPLPVVPKGGNLRRWWWASGSTRTRDVDELTTTFAARGLAAWADWQVWYPWAAIHTGRYLDEVVAEARTEIADELAAEEPDDAAAVADRVVRERLFGAGHPYAAAPRAALRSMRTLRTGQLEAWRRAHYRPRGATLVVTGAFDPQAVRHEIDALYGTWADVAPESGVDAPPARPAAGPSWLAVDAPRALQVDLTIAFAGTSRRVADRAARLVLVEMVREATSDVREGLGASYGVSASYLGGASGSALMISGSVEESRVDVAVPRALAVIERLRTDPVLRREAFVRARRKALLEVEARTAGAASRAREIASAARDGDRSEDQRLRAEVAALTIVDLDAVLERDLLREHMVVALRGRRGAVDAGFRALGVTAERITAPEVEAPTSPRPSAPSATPVPPPPPAGPPGDPALRLEVGSPDNIRGPQTEGLFQGGHRISLDRFLRLSGHGDVASRIVTRRRVRWGLGLAGGLILAGGLYHGLDGERCEYGSVREQQACLDRNNTRRREALGIVLGGGGLLAVGGTMSNLRPSTATLRRYADEHNYRQRIPLEGEALSTSTWTLSPVIGPGQVGLTLTGSL